ncbi:pilus assembly protein N-terminal domain-containing protein [Alcanivorax sp. JB21]|uniref:type II and III secretion system protein family protein n=1 Tax=Alcanivorax limicola TaxID=2874102 RepID=UPI001CBD871B|nr:pilus assembly protein N-terminal domain-containing protein [Alcanivorax limicola]MBZ2189078.1 pilus assembly protein N-terminal domain-containing protein [Alcanivorax limicola]
MYARDRIAHSHRHAAWLAPLTVLLALCYPALLSASDASVDTLRLASGEQQILFYPDGISKVATSAPEVLAVTVSQSRELVLTGKEAGSAILSVWPRGADRPERTTVVVSPTSGARMPFGTQVQTDIRIVEVSRTQLNAAGISYGKTRGSSQFGVSAPGSNFLRAPTDVTPLGGDTFNIFRIGNSSLTAISALEAGGFAYTLAEPSLTSLSGQNATFLSGGEFPVPTRSDVSGTQIEFKEFGVGLALTPTVISAEQIILRVAPEVSELDFSAGIASGGVQVPALRVRRSETTVSLAPGETFIISGLVSRNTINASDRLPGLGNLPILGAFFRSSRIEREDKELIMLVTPYIVSPAEVGAPPPSLPGAAEDASSMGWLDMMLETQRGSAPVRHGLSW